MKTTTEKKKRNPFTIKASRASYLYLTGFVKQGNGKLLDYDDEETGISYRYAQWNTRAIKDCPFRSEGCEQVCYATKGNHQFKNVKESRERSYEQTKREDFGKAMIYTIKAEKRTKRFKNNVMVLRIHESGDFYNIKYLKEWIKVWRAFENDNLIVFVFYTKSFPLFNMLTKGEKRLIRRLQRIGRLAISASLDDTTTIKQRTAYLEMIKNFPKTNTYYCTEKIENVKHDNVCDCANCAKCGMCNSATGKTTVVKIHSASEKDLKKYRESAKKTA